jgi:hypothetical protein
MQRARVLWLVLACVSCGWCGVVSAQAPTPQPTTPNPAAVPAAASVDPLKTLNLSGRALRWQDAAGQPQQAELPCEGTKLLVTTAQAFVACGAQGLVVVRFEGAVVELRQRRVAGQVVGVFESDGQVWLKITKQEALPMAEAFFLDAPQGEPSQAVVVVQPQTPPVEPPPAPPAVGEILENHLDAVIISLGEAHGLHKGDNVEVFAEETRSLGQGNETRVERRVLIGKVTDVGEDRAEVALGTNEEVPTHARVRPTSAPSTASLIRPRRADDLWEISATIRPFLALGTLGAGSVSEVSVGYRFASPLHIALYLEPLSFGFAESGNVLAVAGNAFAAYDTQYFEIGLGLGWSAINSTPDSLYSYDEATGQYREETFERVRSGLSIGQIVRLGARDGLNLEVRNGFLLVSDQFDYGGTVGHIQIPLDEHWWLLLRGGGGAAGYAYGELGLRVLTHGNGERNSVFLTASVGGAEVWGEEDAPCTYDPTQTCTNTISYGGPMAGFGVEWRP